MTRPIWLVSPVEVTAFTASVASRTPSTPPELSCSLLGALENTQLFFEIPLVDTLVSPRLNISRISERVYLVLVDVLAPSTGEMNTSPPSSPV
ncbi:hypothetical protein THF1C08_10257 [Vibrio jasicida]|uniref:Secreted protein n=1 Tax=Vibrio jasicida TaxID=766224 RepID=A0AAU9QGH9_9VIBR|nr:hypothetical protein THF1C08_10257 [Vibrio jasicida]CAH1564296.1 hypothetical protein THF1A12_10257 [Vibrio jasicida]